jgi:hypothetical protein
MRKAIVFTLPDEGMGRDSSQEGEKLTLLFSQLAQVT